MITTASRRLKMEEATLLFFLLLLPLATPQTTTVDVKIPQGTLRGNLTGGIAAFMGIPFAAPPTGENRWQPPKPAQGWSGVRNAQYPGNICPQTYVPGLVIFGVESEDCLLLNVFSPWKENSTAETKYPVMVWIHGGGFAIGDNWNNALYNGFGFLKQSSTPVVLVSINYRLNILGFGAGMGTTGNYGLMDQQLALQWVQNNINFFGGDPNSVTIFGQSAGSISACLHQVIPSSKGLFHKAIQESGDCYLADVPSFNLSYGLQAQRFRQNAAKFGCTTIHCMRQLDWKTMVKNTIMYGHDIGWVKILGWFPVVDGSFIPQNPNDVIRAGKQLPVPVILGTVLNEGSTFVWPPLQNHTAADTLKIVDRYYSNRGNGTQMWSAYDALLPSTLSAGWKWSGLQTDLAFYCATTEHARLNVKHGIPTWVYVFTHLPRFAKLIPSLSGVGVPHGIELFFLFAPYGFFDGPLTSKEEKVLAKRMVNAWTSFAKWGTTKHASVTWAPFMGDVRLNWTTTSGATPPDAAPGYKEDRCNLLVSEDMYSQ